MMGIYAAGTRGPDRTTVPSTNLIDEALFQRALPLPVTVVSVHQPLLLDRTWWTGWQAFHLDRSGLNGRRDTKVVAMLDCDLKAYAETGRDCHLRTLPQTELNGSLPAI